MHHKHQVRHTVFASIIAIRTGIETIFVHMHFSMETMSNDTEKRMVLKRVIYAKHVPSNKIIIVADDEIILD